MASFHLYFLTSLLIQYCTSDTSQPTSPTNLPTNSPSRSPTISYDLSQDISNEGCYAQFNTVGAYFNLCPLKKSEANYGQIKYYKVEDSRDVNRTTIDADHIYAYYFNVADKLLSVPPICSNVTHGYCPPNTDCSQDTNLIPIPTDTSWAYQVKYDLDRNVQDCWALSNNMSYSDVEWTLIEERDPSLGVQLTYINGEYDDVCKNNRKFNIRFECEDNILFIPDQIPLYEYSPCEYTITIPHQYGCPIQCKLYDDQLCDSNGLCAYDRTNHQTKCFCFNKYTSDDCSLYDETAGIPDDSQKPPPDETSPFVFSFDNDETSGVKVTYDLRAFGSPESQAQENGGVYIVHDRDFDNDKDRTWTYYVAISSILQPGGDVLPEFCKDMLAPCKDIETNISKCVEEKTWNRAGLVFQANNATKECFLLGQYIPDKSPNADLYDKIDDPARGVTVTYSGGSWCEAAKRNREFRVNLVCPKDQSAVYDPYDETSVNLYEYVEEEETCVYEFTMESAVACPYQCITNGTDAKKKEEFTVCNQKGICADDPEAGFVRCLCNDGWKDAYCNIIDSPNPTNSPTMAPTAAAPTKKGGFIAVIVILIVIILAVVGIGYYVYRNQKLRISQQEDEIAFHEMKDDGDTVQTNIITDDKGKRGFAVIDAQPKNITDDGD